MNELFANYHTLISPYVIVTDAVEQVNYTHPSNTVLLSAEWKILKEHVIMQNKTAAE